MNKFVRSVFSLAEVKYTHRCYSKNVLRRKPIKVLNVPEDTLTSIQNEARSPKILLSNQMDDTLVKVSPESNTKLIPYYEKLQKSDPRFTKSISLIKDRQMRDINGKFLLEGKRQINDAIDAGMELQTLYFCREQDLLEINFRRAPNVQKLQFFKVLYKQMQMWSYLTTCPGVMGIFKTPSIEDIHMLSEPALPVNIICDNIQDPGNLGSIIRNAASAGCQNIFLMKGCVDPMESKVIKTGCGGHFRIPIIKNIEWTHLSNYISKESHIFIADNSADLEQTPEFINYDESPEEVGDISEDEDAIKKYATLNEHNQLVHVDETLQKPELEMLEDIKLPCYNYSSVKFPKENLVIYVGGDTDGVDSRIVKLACDYGGKKIKIPLENNIGTLNSSFSLTIILYEIKRQLTEKYVTK